MSEVEIYRRLEVSVDEILGVHELQGFRNLFDDHSCFIFSERDVCFYEALEITALDELHGEIEITRIFIPTEKLDKSLLILSIDLQSVGMLSPLTKCLM